MMTRTPWHLWAVGLLSLLWNAGGAADYVMVQYDVAAYTDQLTDPQRGFFDALPAWYVAAWATGVWLSVVGSLLLLLRSRWAGTAFSVSLAGLLVASVYTFLVLDSSPMRDAGPLALAFTAAIYVVLVLLILYARAMRRRGVLT